MSAGRFKNIIYRAALMLWVCAVGGTAQVFNCKANEEHRICGPNCPMTCDLVDMNVCCDFMCVSGCFCKDGFIRTDDSNNAVCVPLGQCPKPGTVQFSTNSLTVQENIGVVRVLVTRTDGTKGQISVKWRVRNETAIAFEDFLGVGGVLTFEDGQTEAFVDVSIIDDIIRESAETFSIELYNPSRKVIIGQNRIITITIIDNDEKPGRLAFESSRIEVPESIGKAEITIIRTEGTDGRVTVLWSTNDGTAVAGLDFGEDHGMAVFEEGESRKTIFITIINDDQFEADEEFSMTLSNPSSGAILGLITTVQIQIVDDDRVPGILQFRVSQLAVSESISSVRITVVRVEGSDGVVRVRFRSVDKTAVRDLDYKAISGELEFANGVTAQTIQVEIIDDADREDDEDFTIQLFDPSGGASLGVRKSHVITILDDDSKPGILQFQKTSVTVTEKSRIASLIVVRSNGSDGEVSVQWQTQSVSATGGEDYIESSGRLIFGDGITEKVLEIPILDDSEEEPTEKFSVELFDAEGGARIGKNNRATIFIEDDDEKPSVIQFKRRRGTVRENAGVVRIPVKRSVNFKNEVRVSWRTIDRSAKPEMDFVSSRGSLTFAPGMDEQNIEIVIINDHIQENNELFDVILFQPSPNAVIGIISKHTVQILDDDEDPAQFSFENTRLIVNEADGQVRLIVVRTGAMHPATVQLRTVDQTASAGIHFKSVNRKLQFAKDQTEEVVLIEIFDDGVKNPPRTFLAELFSPSFGGTIVNGKATVTIENNNVKPLVQDAETVPPPTLVFTTSAPPRPASASKRCPAGLVFKECERTCPESCESLKLKLPCSKSVDHIFKCIRGCFCPPGLVLATGGGSICIPPSDCFREISTITASHISFRDIEIKVKESDGFVLLSVLRSRGVGTLTVLWRVIDVTAVLNVHYRVVAQLNKLVLKPTDLETVIRIEIINNNVPNPPRIFKVELFSLLNTNIFVSGRSTCTVTIEDDDDLVVTRPSVSLSCPPGLILKECERSCPPSCDDWQQKKLCTVGFGRFPCVRGCFCPPGLVLHHSDGDKCVRPSDCGCPPTMVKATCKPACEMSCEQLVCPRQHVLFPSLFGPQSSCSHNCVCPDGLVLEKRGGNKCVTRASCVFTPPVSGTQSRRFHFLLNMKNP